MTSTSHLFSAPPYKVYAHSITMHTVIWKGVTAWKMALLSRQQITQYYLTELYIYI